MASTDSRPIPIKNTAYRATFPIFDADGDLVTGAAGLDSEVSKDQGTFADCTNEATEIATASGMYYIDLTSTEMNADCVAVIVKTSTVGAKTTPLVIYPQESGDIKVDVQSWLGTTVSTPTVAGVPNVNAKTWNDLTTVALPLVPATAGRTLVVDASGLADANVVKVGPTGSGTAQTAGDLKASIAAVQSDTDDIQTRIPSALVSGRIDASVGAMAANVMTAAAAASDLTTELQAGLATSSALATVAGYIDTEVADIQSRLPAALVSGRMDSSVGAMASGVLNRAALAADTGLQSIRSNTAQSGSGTSITLDASASAVTDFYKNALIIITGGTGVGQGRFCTAYNGTSKAATVSAWATNPDNTSTFAIVAFDAIVGATAPTAAQVATAVWQDLLAGSDFATAASIGKLLKDDIDAAISSRASQTSVDTVDDFLDTEIASLQADTDDIQARLPAALTANGNIKADALRVGGTAQTAGDLATLITAVDDFVDTEVAAIKTVVDSIQVDTDDIQARLPAALTANGNMKSDALRVGGTTQTGGDLATLITAVDDFVDTEVASILAAVDTEVAAIKAKTDQLVFTTANQVDATAVTSSDKTGYRLSATGVDDIFDEATSGHTSAGTYGDKLGAHIAAVGKLVVDAGSGTTTVVFKTVDGAAASGTDDYYNGRVIVFTSGAMALQATAITDYVGATKTATVVAMTGTPANNVTGVIV